ncbi:MAG: AAA family ATPase [Chitinophagales bacterium]|nr:AAA family ATPase [Chitinophagales bacterium]
MKIQHISISRLFDQFDYEIPLANEAGLVVLTGPNGYGKTTILRILGAILGERIIYNNILSKLQNIPFKTINITFSDGKVMKLDRTENTPFTMDGLSTYMRTPISVYRLQDQRILSLKNADKSKLYNVTLSITEFAQQLATTIQQYLSQSDQIARQLDSSFPLRVLSESVALLETEFNRRFLQVKNKQDLLCLYGIYDVEQAIPSSFDPESGRLLSVYLADTEKKLAVFDPLLEKLNLFVDIINKRKFANKTLKIDREKGFYFATPMGKEVELAYLSSGEQQELILLYRLIFTLPATDTLLLIDEPETSLHVVWQETFLDDLLRIMQLYPNQIQAIVATHSPQIINLHGDLVVDLYRLQKKNTQNIGNK